MPYTRPDYDAADADFTGATAYTLPAYGDCDARFDESDPEAIIVAGSMLGAETLLCTASMAGLAAVDSPLGPELAFAAFNNALISLGGFFEYQQGVRVFGNVESSAHISVASPLSANVYSVGFSDVSEALLTLRTEHYGVDVTTPGGVVSLPISSWSASLEVDKSSYIGCVVPHATDDVLATFDDMTSYAIKRYAALPSGEVVTFLVAEAIESLRVQTDRGPTNSTATLSGYTPIDAYPANDAPDALYDRTLEGVRSSSVYASGARVRARIDWLLLPGQRALYNDGGELIADRISYQAGTVDSYMDVTEIMDSA